MFLPAISPEPLYSNKPYMHNNNGDWAVPFRLAYHAGKNVYLPVFCFEGLISEFPKITYRFPSLRASFSSQVKNV